MELDYKLAKELKDAGFPQIKGEFDRVHIPTLSELMNACVEKLDDDDDYGDNDGLTLWRFNGKWRCGVPEQWGDNGVYGKVTGAIGKGLEPEEAVARLWLALNK